MNRMNVLDQMNAMTLLRQNAWTHAISVDARDPTLGGLWLSITQAFARLLKKDPSLRYWLTASIGSITEKPHYHGVLTTVLPQREIRAAFKECNAPTLRELYDANRWYDYTVKQGLNETTITNVGE
jgi:hypothetical protein